MAGISANLSRIELCPDSMAVMVAFTYVWYDSAWERDSCSL